MEECFSVQPVTLKGISYRTNFVLFFCFLHEINDVNSKLKKVRKAWKKIELLFFSKGQCGANQKKMCTRFDIVRMLVVMIRKERKKTPFGYRTDIYWVEMGKEQTFTEWQCLFFSPVWMWQQCSMCVPTLSTWGETAGRPIRSCSRFQQRATPFPARVYHWCWTTTLLASSSRCVSQTLGHTIYAWPGGRMRRPWKRSNPQRKVCCEGHRECADVRQLQKI